MSRSPRIHLRRGTGLVFVTTALALNLEGMALGNPVHHVPDDERLEAAAASADQVPVGVAMELVPEKGMLNLGVDARCLVTFRLSGVNAMGARPARGRASVGTLGPFIPSPVEPGTFLAEYEPPSEMRPQAAILVVETRFADGRRAHAVARIKLEAPTRFPLRSSPNARVTLEVNGQVFGPELADADGQVFVPIVVPPGVATGTARAVNEFGVAKETTVDLQVADYPRVLLLSEPEGEVGSHSLAEVWASTPAGDPASPEDVDLGASSGKVKRLATTAAGGARFLVSLPRSIGSGKVSLIASTNDGSATDLASVILVPGPPAQLEMAADPRQLVVGSATHAAVTVVARDRFGNVLSPKNLLITADDVRVPVQVAPDMAVVHVAAPARWTGRDQLHLLARLGDRSVTMDLLLTGGFATAATLEVDRTTVLGSGNDGVELCLTVRDAQGIPTTANQLNWRFTEPGRLIVRPSVDLGTYRVRYQPMRTLHDSDVELIATLDDRFSTSVTVRIEAVAPRTLSARVGVASNLGPMFGPTLFIDALEPINPRGALDESWTRLLGVGVSAGYVHGELTTESVGDLDGVHVELNQLPVLAIARVRIPARLPAEVFVLATAGITFAQTQIVANKGMGGTVSSSSAFGATYGIGGEAAVALDPGQLLFGARYLSAKLGRTRDGDLLSGNSIGLVCDLGFKMGF